MDELISKTKVGKTHSISHLLMSERLEETGSPKIILASMLVIFLVLGILVVWAAFTNVDQVATATGEIIPLDKIAPVQHIEGGIVFRVFVKDGDEVKKGEPLFELNPEPYTSDLKRLKKRQNALEINIYILQAILSENPIRPSDLMEAVSYKDVTEPSMLRLQLNNAQMYQEQEIQQRGYNREQLASRLSQEKQNLKNIEQQLYHMKQRRKVLEDQLAMFDLLSEQQAVSKIDYLNMQGRLEQLIGEFLEVTSERTAIETTILELENELKTLEFNKDNDILKRLNDDTSKLLEVQEQLARAQITVDRLIIKAETSGVVKGLSIRPGDVVAAADELFQIVPLTTKLIADIKISTTDVGHVEIGDSVQIKVGTYDFSTYGSIPGTLDFVSASTFLDPERKPYYRGIVSLSKNYLGEDPNRNQVFPGMTVTAEIKTSQKSLLNYLLKPINRTFGEAFRER